MGYCIYFNKFEPNLHFAKEEHVIPAGLGGIQKLEKGTVSDEANAQFSKLETVALRNSFIAINRMNFGPGKRGSLNVKKIKSPIMRVLKQDKESNTGGIEFLLGFIFSGQSYIIPQIIFNFDDEKDTVLPMYMSTTLNEHSIEDFHIDLNKKLIQFFKNKKRLYKLVHMPFEINKHFINIGYYQGKWYAATSHKIINMDFLAHVMLPMLDEMIKKSANNKNFSKPQITHKPILKYKDQINTDASNFYFLYLKTAFNALALFKGPNFVCNEIFDEIRESILHLSNINKFIQTNKELYDPKIELHTKSLPDKAHYVIICANDNNLNAYVSFYGEIPGMVKLTDKYQGADFFHGLICDWKNRREFRLEI
ncbi:MAG: hypothetical protein LBV11_07230 [Bacillus cereus]|jgi:hypothetical protein|nr:hypothetical protein [Bacillus cereus]